jgi:outer membrane biosynthesis protein TonB
MLARFDRQHARALWSASVAWFEGDGRGVLGSLALHGLFALMVLAMMLRGTVAPTVTPPHPVPVEIVTLGTQTTSPPAPVKAKIPQPAQPRTRPHPPASANRPEGTRPHATKPLPDDLETKLNSLAHLKAPQSNVKPLPDPAASEAATSNDAAPGNEAAYAVRDLIRAQVERKWNFNVVLLGRSSFTIALRVTVLRNGTVAKAEILDRERYTNDALYRDIALSARNAVLLASPLTMPDGAFGDQVTVTLNLNPRDTLR